MKRYSLFILCLFITSSCSSSRWIVTDQNSINRGEEPVILNEEHILLLQDGPTVDNPVMSFGTYKVVEKKYEERVRVERSIQKYRPKWGFVTLGLTGAVFAALTANTGLVFSSISARQRVSLNIAAGILAGLSFVNMEPVGDPIFTGETRLQRRSGSETIKDTVKTSFFGEGLNVSLDMLYKNEIVFSEPDIVLSDGSFDLNLASFLQYLDDDIHSESTIEIQLAYNGFQSSHTVPVTDFLAPFVRITEPVAVLRNAPEVSALNIVTEVGSGSSLELLSAEPENWYRVRFGGSEVFVSRNAGEVEWMSEAESGSPDIFEFIDVPFGQIDVENSVPVLKQHNPDDRAIILTNNLAESVESRQYLNRDHELFRFYMRYSLQMESNQIYQIEMDTTGSWEDSLASIPPVDSTGVLVVYLSGMAVIDDSGAILMSHGNPATESSQPASMVVDALEQVNPAAAVLFVDLEFSYLNISSTQNRIRSTQMALQLFSNDLLRKIPNSAIVFSNRPGQHSSLYAASGNENKRHHIFNYYLADALKKRNTTVSGIVRHLENNVDYTSRRLHDRPQEIQAFGNLTINLAE